MRIVLLVVKYAVLHIGVTYSVLFQVLLHKYEATCYGTSELVDLAIWLLM
jgi:hypothetical protein